jgi:hypothetical protein
MTNSENSRYDEEYCSTLWYAIALVATITALEKYLCKFKCYF